MTGHVTAIHALQDATTGAVFFFAFCQRCRWAPAGGFGNLAEAQTACQRHRLGLSGAQR